MKNPILKSGIFRWSNLENAKNDELSISKFVKKLLTNLNITFVDPCCPATEIQPLRYNSTTGTIQSFNGTAWVDIGLFP